MSSKVVEAKTIDVDVIGTAAGVVWERLRREGEAGVFLTDLKKTPGLRADEVTAAVGWLAREGKLHFTPSGRRVSIALDGRS